MFIFFLINLIAGIIITIINNRYNFLSDVSGLIIILLVGFLSTIFIVFSSNTFSSLPSKIFTLPCSSILNLISSAFKYPVGTFSSCNV